MSWRPGAILLEVGVVNSKETGPWRKKEQAVIRVLSRAKAVMERAEVPVRVAVEATMPAAKNLHHQPRATTNAIIPQTKAMPEPG
jgi:hypothetical protein